MKDQADVAAKIVELYMEDFLQGEFTLKELSSSTASLALSMVATLYANSELEREHLALMLADMVKVLGDPDTLELILLMDDDGAENDDQYHH